MRAGVRSFFSRRHKLSHHRHSGGGAPQRSEIAGGREREREREASKQELPPRGFYSGPFGATTSVETSFSVYHRFRRGEVMGFRIVNLLSPPPPSTPRYFCRMCRRVYYFSLGFSMHMRRARILYASCSRCQMRKFSGLPARGENVIETNVRGCLHYTPVCLCFF